MAIIKAVLLGDTEVGKTSFSSRWTKGTFPDPSLLRTTVGASFDTKEIELSNGEHAVISLWDFGGQRRFIETLKSMVRGARIGLLFFDVSHLPSLDNLYTYWIPLLEEDGHFSFPDDGGRFILVANKIDLIPDDFSRIDAEMKAFCERFGTEQAMISAKTGVGIEQLDYKFKLICEKYL